MNSKKSFTLLSLSTILVIMLNPIGNLSRGSTVEFTGNNIDYSALMDERAGFAENVSGGYGGTLYIVNSSADSGPETLRDALECTEKLWIRFASDMTIVLESDIEGESNKTIDGRGVKVIIQRWALSWAYKSEIIIHNIEMNNGLTGLCDGGGCCPEGDAITFNHCDQIWIDHCTLGEYEDELIAANNGSGNITISWCKFQNQDGRVILMGNNQLYTQDESLRVTIHHNWFTDTKFRMPRGRYGKFHTFNNFFDGWSNYGAQVSCGAQLYSEQNIYDAHRTEDFAIQTDGIVGAPGAKPGDPKIDEPDGYATSVGDWFIRKVNIQLNGEDFVFKPIGKYDYSHQIEAGDKRLKKNLEEFTGRQDVEVDYTYLTIMPGSDIIHERSYPISDYFIVGGICLASIGLVITLGLILKKRIILHPKRDKKSL